MVAWTSDVGAYFDYAALTEQGCVDLWLDMAYAWCIDYEAHSSTRNRAPTPLPFIDDIIHTYETTFKVPREKLGVVFPWYACSFECAGEGDAYGNKLSYTDTPFNRAVFGNLKETRSFESPRQDKTRQSRDEHEKRALKQRGWVSLRRVSDHAENR